MGMGIADNWFKNKFEKILYKMINKVGHSLTEREKDKIITNTSKIYMFIVTISFAIFMIYFFSTMIYERIGFEKTIIIILSIIMLRMRWN